MRQCGHREVFFILFHCTDPSSWIIYADNTRTRLNPDQSLRARRKVFKESGKGVCCGRHYVVAASTILNIRMDRL